MDWRTAKRWLLVGFLILDAFLFFEWRHNLPASLLPGVGNSRPALAVTTTTPLAADPLPRLRLTPMDPSLFAHALLGKNYKHTAGSPRYSAGRDEVTAGGSDVRFQGTFGSEKSPSGQTTAVAGAQAFLKHLQLPVTFGRPSAAKTAGGYQVTLPETAEGVSIENAWARVEVTPGGKVESADFQLFIAAPAGPPMNLLPAFQAIGIWEANQSQGMGHATITAISLIYPASSTTGQALEEPPAWLINLSDHRTVTINAYTGVSQP